MGADEDHKSEQDAKVTLSFTGTDVSFHCGPAAISISGDCADCCKLLSSLREESDAAENIPVALSFDALKAWVAFLEGRQSTPKSPQGRKNLSDTTLLQALEAADFLQDQSTSDLIASALAHAFEPTANTNEEAEAGALVAAGEQHEHNGGTAAQRGASSGSRDSDSELPAVAAASRRTLAPTAAQRARAASILRAASVRTIPRLFAAIHPRPLSTARHEVATRASDAAALRHLLMLLPAPILPAVLHARFPSIQADRCLSLPEMPALSKKELDPQQPTCLPLSAMAVMAAAHFARPSTVLPAGGDGADDRGTSSAPESLKRWRTEMNKPHKLPRRSWRLHASAPLELFPPRPAGGESTDSSSGATGGDDGGDDGGGGDGDGDGIAGASDGPAASDDSEDAWLEVHDELENKCKELLPAAEWEAPGAGITQLRLSLEPSQMREPWARGTLAMSLLGALRSLQKLSLASRFVGNGDVDVDALCTSLHLLPALTALHLTAERPAHIDGELEPETQQLLGGISMLPRLAELALERCFITSARWHRLRDPVRPDQTFDQLSRLTGLTSLSLRDNLVRRRDVGVKLGKALRRLKRLRQLSVANIDDGSTYAIDVLINTGFPDLEALNFGGFAMADLGRLAHCLIAKAHGAGVTALGLDHGVDFPGEAAAAAAVFTQVPQAFPALQFLSVRHAQMADAGFHGLAAVLPELTALHSLDVAHNCATHEGLLSLLAAAVKLGDVAGRGLRRLGVAGAHVGPDRAMQMVGLLTPLTLLEELDLSCLDVGAAGVRGAVVALARMPHLRALNLSNNCQTAADAEAMPPLLADLKGLRRLVMHEPEVSDTAAVRAAVEGAAPWLEAITLGRVCEPVDELAGAVVWGSSWMPWTPEEPWM